MLVAQDLGLIPIRPGIPTHAGFTGRLHDKELQCPLPTTDHGEALFFGDDVARIAFEGTELGGMHLQAGPLHRGVRPATLACS